MESYLPTIKLTEYFKPTASTSGEWRKARIKNANLPILQYIYNGDEQAPLECKISNTPGWANVPDYGTKINKLRFRIDFNHVRQKCTSARQSGKSLDKGYKSPSDIFRGWYFDPSRVIPDTNEDFNRKLNLVEFLTIMPVCTEHHSYISQDSAKSDLTLDNFPKNTWIWALQNSDNFEIVKEKYRFNLDYQWFIDHMTNIRHENIRTRIINEIKDI